MDHGFAESTHAAMGALMPVTMTYRERLEHQKKMLETRLADINRMLEMMDQSPALAEMLELSQKLGHV